MLRSRWLILLVTLVVLLGAGAPVLYYKEKHGGINNNTAEAQALKPVKTVDKPKESYDAIVVGTDPEGVAAAVSAARNGLKTLLVDDRDREVLGGLMTLGWLNTIDLDQDKEQNYSNIPGTRVPVLNKGIFSEFYNMIEGTSFDVTSAINAFHKLVNGESNIDVLLKAKTIDPLVKKSGDTDLLEGVTIVAADGKTYSVKAKTVIDATQDADLAAAAGVPFTIGREDLGDKDSKMAVTVVFKMKNVDASVWQQIRKRFDEDNNPATGADEMSAWGYGEMNSAYVPQNPERVKVRGPNIGRQNDNTALLNMIQLFGVDGKDPKSRAEAYELAKSEVPHILDYMKKNYPEFAKVEFDGVAPELYVRETRHMEGLYRLSIIDVLDNRDQWDRIGFGSYTVDIQRTGPKDSGSELLKPIKYAIPFRSIVPKKVDGLLVVGRSASYDTLSHGSARVIPNGMAEGEAAGAAAKLAIDNKLTFRKLAESKDLIAKLQDQLNKQGMDIKPYTLKEKPAYMTHKTYPGLKAAVYFNVAAGRGEKGIDFELDNAANPQRIVNQLTTIKKILAGKGTNQLKGNPNDALAGYKGDVKTDPLTLTQAAYTIAKALGLNVSPDKAVAELQNKKLLTKETVALIGDQKKITYGEAYLLYKDMLESFNYRF